MTTDSVRKAQIIEGMSTITSEQPASIDWCQESGADRSTSKHRGHWIKIKYNLGRYSCGGHWSCCGQSNKLARPCNGEMQELWNKHKTDVDVVMAKKAVRRALAQSARSKWNNQVQAPSPSERPTKLSNPDQILISLKHQPLVLSKPHTPW